MTDRMTLAAVQRELGPWQRHNFPDSEQWEPLVGAVEELGELAHAFLKRHQRIRLNEDHDAKLRDALGDVLIYLCDFANREGVDLEEVLAETWAEVGGRDWAAHREAYGLAEAAAEATDEVYWREVEDVHGIRPPRGS